MKTGGGEEFWTLTLRQVKRHFDAYLFRLDREGQLRAHFTSHLMNCWIPKRKRVRPKQIWRPSFSENRKTEEEHQEEFEDMVERMGPDAIPVDRNKGGS